LEAHRFRTIKLKSGVFAPEAEIEAMRQLRAAFPQARLRYDPNAAWSVETGLRLLPALGELDPEYAEDIVDGLEAMSRLRQAVPVPLATNICVIAFEHIPLSFRLRSVDIILSDVHFWGGLHLNRKLATVAETLKIGLGMHSDRELGISTAAMVHLAAATPTLVYAIDSHYHQQADDIITEPFRYRDGGFDLPKGPGLGVNLDADKLAHYHRVWQEQGDVNEFLDPRRPGWVPVLPLFCRPCLAGPCPIRSNAACAQARPAVERGTAGDDDRGLGRSRTVDDLARWQRTSVSLVPMASSWNEAGEVGRMLRRHGAVMDG
jgi:glucarate dehydratase